MSARKHAAIWIGFVMLMLALGFGLTVSGAFAGAPTGKSPGGTGLQAAGASGKGAGGVGSVGSAGGRTFSPATPTCTPDTYTIVTGTATLVPGTEDTGNHCDECTTAITLPFGYHFYDQSFTSARVESNGTLQFAGDVIQYNNVCLPAAYYAYTIFPHWDDLRTDGTGVGVFTSVTGSAPNRIFNIEWRACYYQSSPCSATNANFEIRLYEGQDRFDIVYGTVGESGTGATVGSQMEADSFTQFECNTGGLSEGLQLTFNEVIGTCPTATPTLTPTATPTAISCPNSWTEQAPYPRPIWDNAVTEQGGILYSFGGISNHIITHASSKYDPATNAWTGIAAFPGPGEEPNAVSDGTYIYLVGGNGGGNLTSTLYRYDPAANTYITRTSYTVATWAQSAAYLNGKIYRIGGCLDGNCTSFTDTVEVYDIAFNSWSMAAPLPQPSGWVISVASGGYIYAMGGSNPANITAKTYRYDPVTNAWDDAAMADLPVARWGGGVDVLSDGKVIIAGGIVNPGVVTDSVIFWDPVTNTWGNYDPMLQPRFRTAGAAIGDAYYNIGGNDPQLSGTGTTDNQRYLNTCATTATPSPTATSQPTATATGTPCTITFTDVHPTDYFYEAVSYLYCHHVISGYADNTFRPYNNTTRGQMAKIVVLGFGIPIWTPTGTPTFSDVPPTNAFYPYIETAAHNNIVSGYADGTYRPFNNVTRGQLSKIIVVGATIVNGWPLLNPPTPTFSDVPPNSPFYTYIETAYCHGIISGYADGSFRPGADATRGQISKIQYLAILNTTTCAVTPTAPKP